MMLVLCTTATYRCICMYYVQLLHTDVYACTIIDRLIAIAMANLFFQ